MRSSTSGRGRLLPELRRPDRPGRQKIRPITAAACSAAFSVWGRRSIREASTACTESLGLDWYAEETRKLIAQA